MKTNSNSTNTAHASAPVGGVDRLREKGFENVIEAVLLEGGPDAAQSAEAWNPIQRARGPFARGGYRKRLPTDYDRQACLDIDLLIEFLQTSQPDAWDTLEKRVGESAARNAIVRDVSREIASHGLVRVLRSPVPVKIEDVPFRLAYFPPSSNLNPEDAARYKRNIFSLVRQLRYSARSDKSVDMALFLNGIPFATLELKNRFSGQTVDDAMRQYQTDRDPKEPLLAPRRCVVHFAVDTEQVYMTAELAGAATRFLPFNQGRDGGAGNPRLLDNYATAYLWEQILARDSVLNLLQHFVYEVEKEKEGGSGGTGGGAKRKTRTRHLLFPRFQQIEAVRQLVEDARANGAGKKYLIQHSAGSGKGNSIGWLAHQLSSLHDKSDNRVFTDILVITDRLALDRQLQDIVTGFEKTRGTVRHTKKSADLAHALNDRIPIIVTTLQKFPHILNEVEKRGDRRFALIIDEAHSSQAGEAARDVSRVLREASGPYDAAPPDEAALAAARLEEAEAEETGETLDEMMAREMKAKAHLTNASYFAFTATPKPSTRELFGTKRTDGSYGTFHTYTMRQAIEEGFILDVLRNYVTYRQFFELAQKSEKDELFDKARAKRILTGFAQAHPNVIREKVAAMLCHFHEVVEGALDSEARAMIVASSRMEALLYHQEAEKYLKEQNRSYRSLVAFSGPLTENNIDWTESSVNGFPESQTRDRFREDPYRILVVANKYQTGYDEPLLCAMYVDKKIRGVAAVQTLSRLNRTHPGKTEVWALDFVNAPEDIQQGFQDYYDRAILRQGTDPRLLTDLQRRLRDFGLYDDAIMAEVVTYFHKTEKGEPGFSQPGLEHLVQTRIVDDFEAMDEGKRVEFARLLTDYIRLYSFLSQVLRSADGSLEKLYQFARIVRLCLPPLRTGDLTRDEREELVRAVTVSKAGVVQTGRHQLALHGQVADVEPQGAKSSDSGIEAGALRRDHLSVILSEINDRFGIPEEKARPFVEDLRGRLEEDARLRHTFATNASSQERRLVFRRRVTDHIQDMLSVHFEMYKQVNDNPDWAEGFIDYLTKDYENRLGDGKK